MVSFAAISWHRKRWVMGTENGDRRRGPESWTSPEHLPWGLGTAFVCQWGVCQLQAVSLWNENSKTSSVGQKCLNQPHKQLPTSTSPT